MTTAGGEMELKTMQKIAQDNSVQSVLPARGLLTTCIEGKLALLAGIRDIIRQFYPDRGRICIQAGDPNWTETKKWTYYDGKWSTVSKWWMWLMGLPE